MQIMMKCTLYLVPLILMRLTREATGENASISLPESLHTRQTSGNKWFVNPYTFHVKMNVTSSTVYEIRGNIPAHAKKFTVELCPELECYPVKTLHISVRLNHQIVVRTHRYGGQWGKEQTRGDMPFTRGKNFTLKIQNTAANIKLFVNNAYFTDYKHEVPLADVTYIKVYGDALINRASVYSGIRYATFRSNLEAGDWILYKSTQTGQWDNFKFTLFSSETYHAVFETKRGRQMEAWNPAAASTVTVNLDYTPHVDERDFTFELELLPNAINVYKDNRKIGTLPLEPNAYQTINGMAFRGPIRQLNNYAELFRIP